jgi:hypothetical protein
MVTTVFSAGEETKFIFDQLIVCLFYPSQIPHDIQCQTATRQSDSAATLSSPKQYCPLATAAEKVFHVFINEN